MKKAYVPNFVTLLNLFLGCLALLNTLNGHLDRVPMLVFWAGVADFLDGFVARALKVSSPIGIQLDSLADMVTFGVVPGMALYTLLQYAWGETAPVYYLLPAFSITMFSAIRLAKFNIDTRQVSGFIGLPTPGASAFVLGLVALHFDNRFAFLDYIITNPYFLYGVIIAISYLLVSETHMFSVKFKHRHWRGNQPRFIIIAIFFMLLAFMQFSGGAVLIPIYVLLSMLNNKLKWTEQS